MPEAIDIDLDGDGPFMMPLCTALAVKSLGEFTVFRFATVCGRHVLVTVTEPVAVAVGAIAGVPRPAPSREHVADASRAREPANRLGGLIAMIRRRRAPVP